VFSDTILMKIHILFNSSRATREIRMWRCQRCYVSRSGWVYKPKRTHGIKCRKTERWLCLLKRYVQWARIQRSWKTFEIYW